MELSRYGVPLPEIVALIKEVAPPDEKGPKTFAHVRAALSEKESGKSPRIVRMLVVLCQPEPVEERKQDYQGLVLIDRSIETAEFMAALELSGAGRDLALAGTSQQVDPKANYEFKGSGNVYTGPRPCLLILLPTNDRQPVNDWSRPLLRYGLPAYRGVEDAAAQWIPSIPFGQSHSWLGHVLIAVPLAWPHFGQIRLDENRLHVTFEDAGAVVLECKVIASIGRNIALRQSLPVDGSPLTIDLPPETDELNLWLIDAKSIVRDSFSESGYSCTRTERVLHAPASAAMTEDDILDLITRGESDTLELKPFIRVPDAKAEELVCSAIAFANAAGGAVFLGVSNRGVVDGVEKDAFDFYRPQEAAVRAPTDAVAHYCGVLRKFLVERCAPSLDMDVEPIAIATRTVVRVRVRESAAKMVTDARNGEMYIRRGASNRKPSTAEIERILGKPRREEYPGVPTFHIPPQYGV